jgi:hypothetical protein
VTPWIHWGSLHFASRSPFLLFPNSICGLARPYFIYIRVVHEEGFQRERLREQEVTNVVPAYSQVVKTDGLSTFHCKFHRLQVRVHRNIDAYRSIRKWECTYQ